MTPAPPPPPHWTALLSVPSFPPAHVTLFSFHIFLPHQFHRCTVKQNLEENAKVFRVHPSLSSSLYRTDVYVCLCGRLVLYYVALNAALGS